MERLDSPAAERNKAAITRVLREVLPAKGLALEIASGSGQHVVHFSQEFPDLHFQPSDPSALARGSIEAWVREVGAHNVMPPLDIDCTGLWPDVTPDAVLCINMVHISPWEATVGLLAWCGQNLPASGPLVLYGPYWVEGRPREPSNEDFDRSLRARNPAWGIRSLGDVEARAGELGLKLDRVEPMPANNLIAVFRASHSLLQ